MCGWLSVPIAFNTYIILQKIGQAHDGAYPRTVVYFFILQSIYTINNNHSGEC